jgi:hypothetical protein
VLGKACHLLLLPLARLLEQCHMEASVLALHQDFLGMVGLNLSLGLLGNSIKLEFALSCR